MFLSFLQHGPSLFVFGRIWNGEFPKILGLYKVVDVFKVCDGNTAKFLKFFVCILKQASG